MSEPMVVVSLLVVSVVAIVCLIVACVRLQSQLSSRTYELARLQGEVNQRVQEQLADWRDRELAAVRGQLAQAAHAEARNAFHRWQAEAEANIRADAVRRSAAVVSGKVTEHLTPYMWAFPYNPKDARFLGAPIDLIVFDGLSEGDLRQIVFLEVKTNSSSLSPRERRVRDVVEERKVIWREFRVGNGSAG